MSKELIINASLPELRIALIDEGEIQELLIERKEEKGIVGNIYKGRVTRVLPGMQAAFVDIGLEKAAFLYVDDVYGHSDILDPKDVEDEEYEDEDSEEGMALETSSDLDEEEEDQEGESFDTAASESEIEDDGDDEDAVDDLLFAETEEENIDSEETTLEEVVSSDASEENNNESEETDDVSPAYLQPELEKQEVIAAPEEENQSNSENDEAAGDEQPSEKKVLSIKPASESSENREEKQKSPYLPPVFHDEIHEEGERESDRSDLSFREDAEAQGQTPTARMQLKNQGKQMPDHYMRKRFSGKRPEFRQKRDRGRRINSRQLHRRQPAKIENLLKEGQDVIVQVAKDPIAQKGARLTCHVSLAGRHLVCMPTINHVGVSRRIEKFDERRRLREFVEKNKPKGMGFIIRTASGGKDPETWIKNDIDYLKTLWQDIAEKASESEAPALAYEDVNSVLRALRDWIDEDINKIIIDSRYHYNEVKTFCDKFMPILSPKIELYHGDIPLFDAYGISQELSRAIERKVWLKSGGYLVIDQAEALVAIDVNTGRFVGQKNLEDTILKTNLEAVKEVAYQMRLRNCGGIVIIDLIDMEREENKTKVLRALEEELKKDRSRPSVVRISELGLIELTRKRTRDTMVRILGETCPHCEGKGFIKSKNTVAYELLRNIEREGIHKDIKKILVQAHPDVIDILAIEERDAVDQLEKRYRKKIFLQSVHGFHQEQFEIIPEKNENAPDYREVFNRERDRDRNQQRQRRPSYPQRDRGQNNDKPKAKFSRPLKNKSSNADDDDQTQTLLLEEEPNRTLPRIIPKSELNKSEPIDQDAQPRFVDKSEPRPGLTDEEEEDRLAFLRAQAAQDAAIASLGAQSEVSPSVQVKQQNGRPGRTGQGGRNNNRNGKFSRSSGGSGRGGSSGSNRNGGRNNNLRRGSSPAPRGDRGYHRGGTIEPREPREPLTVTPATSSSGGGSSTDGDSSSES